MGSGHREAVAIVVFSFFPEEVFRNYSSIFLLSNGILIRSLESRAGA